MTLCLYQQLSDHEQTCPEKPVECEYSRIGCEYISAPAQMGEHVRSGVAKHLELATRKFMRVDLENTKLSTHLQVIIKSNMLISLQFLCVLL